jgi:hypothetical protein
VSLVTFNCDGFYSNLAAIEELLDKYSIVLLQEHWLHLFELTAVKELISKNGWDGSFKTYDQSDPIPHTQRKRGQAGVAILWNSSLSRNIERIIDGSDRIVGVRLLSSSLEHRDLLILCVYMPCQGSPAGEYRDILYELEELLSKFSDHDIVIGGDLNASLHRFPKNKLDIILTDFVKASNLGLPAGEDYPTCATYNPSYNDHSSQIDYFLVPWENTFKTARVEVIQDLPMSDSPHNPVVLFTCIPVVSLDIHTKLDMSTTTKPKWDKGDMDTYKSTVETHVTYILPILVPDSAFSVDMAMVKLVHGLQEAERCAIPRSKPAKSNMRSKHPDVVIAMKKSKQAFNTWKISGRPDPGNVTHTEMLSAKKELRSAQRQVLALTRNELYNDIMNAHIGDNQLFYKLVRRQRASTGYGSTILEYKDTTYREEEVAIGFGKYFGDLATPMDKPEYDSQHGELVDRDVAFLDQLAQHCYINGPNIPDVSNQEVALALRKLKTGKACDYFGLTTEHIVYAKTVLVPLLAQMYTSIFQQGTIPKVFREGLLIPLLKKPNKPPKIPTNYRGITIVSILGKLLEHVIVGRIQSIFKKAQSTLQRGFTEDVSPIFAAFILCETINECKDTKSNLYVALLDAEKAFDRVSHSCLFRKLALLGIPIECWKVLRDWYSDLRASVKWAGVISPSFNILQGTLQGSAFSPHAYKMYNNEMLLNIQKLHLGATIGTVNCGAPTCADDVALLANTPHELSKSLARIEDNANKDKLTINASKSALLFYPAKGNAEVQSTDFEINNSSLEVQCEAVHLGINHGPGRTLNKNRVEDSISTATRTLYALFGAGLHGKNGLNPIISKKLWTTYVIPRMLYSSELWQLSKGDIEVLELFQRRKIKEIQGLPSRTANVAALGLLGVFPIQAEIHRRALTLFRNLISNTDSLEREICLRQVAVKLSNSNSWLNYVQTILDLYDLPGTSELLLDVPTRQAWKTLVGKAIKSFWEQQYSVEATEKSTLRHMSQGSLSPQTPALVWSSCVDSLYESKKASVKARFLTDTYKLQSHEARYYNSNQHTLDPTCLLCKRGPETMEHCLTMCPQYEALRANYVTELVLVLLSHDVDPAILHDNHSLLQLTLDASHSALPASVNQNRDLKLQVEGLSRDYIYKLHIKREMLMIELLPPRPRKSNVRKR